MIKTDRKQRFRSLRRGVAAAITTLAVVATPLLASQEHEPGLTTVILVRHAEKAGPGDPEFAGASRSDPPLTAVGSHRAAALAHTLAEAGVTAIYASEYQRTQLTVQPLADAVGLVVEEFPAADVAGLAALVSGEHAGGVVVIAGHSNTVPALVEALGAEPVAPIEEGWEYDNLYVVSLTGDGEARVATLKFGARSEPGGSR